MSYLIVAAHPDDEILGAGATMYNLAKKGEEVYVCIMSGSVLARANRPSDDELSSDLHSSADVIGIKKIFSGDFPNIEFNNVPH